VKVRGLNLQSASPPPPSLHATILFRVRKVPHLLATNSECPHPIYAFIPFIILYHNSWEVLGEFGGFEVVITSFVGLSELKLEKLSHFYNRFE
jgi:hypothetical protein